MFIKKMWTFFLLVFLLFSLSLSSRAKEHTSTYSELPLSGKNFHAYSTSMHALGRCYLQASIVQAITDAYAVLETSLAGHHFVYMETGWRNGGTFRPHRTHTQGISADFLTPVKEKHSGKPTILPISPSNLWGYNIRLTTKGVFKNCIVDTRAMILHMATLDVMARNYGWKIQRVIFDPPLVQLLKKDPTFGTINHINFMKKQAWYPHDGHYHIDFSPLRL